MTKCPECNDTGQRDSGGTHPWGEPVLLPCDCKDAEVGRQWRENSSLERWFPLTAERLASLEAENAALKREAYTWSKAAETYAKPRQPLDPLEVEELWDKANEEWGSSLTDAAEPFRGEDAFQHFARLLERAHGIGA